MPPLAVEASSQAARIGARRYLPAMIKKLRGYLPRWKPLPEKMGSWRMETATPAGAPAFPGKLVASGNVFEPTNRFDPRARSWYRGDVWCRYVHHLLAMQAHAVRGGGGFMDAGCHRYRVSFARCANRCSTGGQVTEQRLKCRKLLLGSETDTTRSRFRLPDDNGNAVRRRRGKIPRSGRKLSRYLGTRGGNRESGVSVLEQHPLFGRHLRQCAWLIAADGSERQILKCMIYAAAVRPGNLNLIWQAK